MVLFGIRLIFIGWFQVVGMKRGQLVQFYRHVEMITLLQVMLDSLVHDQYVEDCDMYLWLLDFYDVP